jgi:hypothetical protein
MIESFGGGVVWKRPSLNGCLILTLSGYGLRTYLNQFILIIGFHLLICANNYLEGLSLISQIFEFYFG